MSISQSFGGLKAAGTGIVLSSDGVVLTNNHVIRDATRIRVRDVASNRTYAASVLGYDIKDDVAVLQLRGASHLRTALLGDSASLGRGDSVAAYGNALGAGGAPSGAKGAITKLDASVFVHYGDGSVVRLTHMIQSNAVTLPGESGGPLVDRNGRVVGVNTAAAFSAVDHRIRSEAIPIARAMMITNAIRARRASPRIHIGTGPWLGVQVVGPDPDRRGVTVAQVDPGSPAAKVGLVPGDVLLTCNNHLLVHPNDLADDLFSDGPGSRATITWITRSGLSGAATVTLASGTPQ